MKERIEQLPLRCTSAFFACCAERLLPLYAAFSDKEGAGDFIALRGFLDSIWDALEDPDTTNAPALRDALRSIDEFTPHAHDSLECTLAQDACIALGSSIQWLLADTDRTADAVEYVLEALRVAICVAKTGCLDLGDGPAADEFERNLERDERILLETSYQEDDLDVLSQTESPTSEMLRGLRCRAVSRCWTTRELLRSP